MSTETKKMTVAEFLALPDREKDALVAEKVMGWLQWTGDGDWDGPEDATFFRDWDDGAGVAVYKPSTEEPAFYFSPSTDISAAWEVVEKIKDKIFGIWWEREPGSKQWSVTLNAVDSYSGAENFEHDRIEMAICLAALRVVGVIE